jgi:hypothetical protein
VIRQNENPTTEDAEDRRKNPVVFTARKLDVP